MNIKISQEYIQYRREGRILAFQVLFSYDFDKKKTDDLVGFDWLEDEVPQQTKEYAEYLIKGTIENLDVIDKKIKEKLKNWDFLRISNIDKAILRFSIFSIFFEQEVPVKVTINEAIEIVKKFGGKDSYKFINGILDAIRKSKESEE